jgi:hypothetical protein
MTVLELITPFRHRLGRTPSPRTPNLAEEICINGVPHVVTRLGECRTQYVEDSAGRITTQTVVVIEVQPGRGPERLAFEVRGAPVGAEAA